MVTAGKIPPFIATLGAMKILRSVTQQFMQSSSPKVPTGFQQIARVKVGGQMFMPILYWLLIALVLYIVSKKTVFGRHVFAVGSNEKTSRLSGINVNRVKLGVYALMGAVVAIAAVLQVSRIGAMDPANAGSGYELDSIAAVIVGGTSMSGGKGSVVGTVFGMLIIAVMNNLLNLLGVPPFLREAFKGAIIIAAVLAAVMSTIDCVFIVVSTVLTRDILIGTMKKEYSEKQLSKITLGLNIALLVVGVTLALNAGSILDVLNAFYAFLAAACFIPFFGGLLWKKGSAKGAIAASVAGIIVVVLGWLGVSLPSLGGFFPCIPSAIAFVIVSLIAPDKAKT